MHRSTTSPALLVAALACGWAAVSAAQEAGLSRLDRIEVIGVANRIDRVRDDVPATASQLTRRDIEREVVTNLRELLRYEPGVTIESSPARFGLGAIGIRGITGNRVLMQVDGIRLPDSYRVGSFSNASRNLLDLGLLQRVEILRGPGSSLYGSDALGGVVAFSTVDPDDVLASGARAGATADLGYASANESWRRGLLVAARGDAVQSLIGYQRSDGHETANRGTDDRIGTLRTMANPQDGASESWLAKLIMPIAGRGRARLTLDRQVQGVKTEVLSLNPQSSRTIRLDGDDLARRERASIDVDLPRFAQLSRLRLLAYTQRSLTGNDTTDVRANTTAVCLSAPGTLRCQRDVRFRFVQKEHGASLLAEADGFGHWLFGLELARIHYDENRDGTQTNLDSGVVSKVVGGERLPTRDFPQSTGDRLGAFVQNEIALASGRLKLVPALRFDRLRSRAHAESIFATANPGRPVVDSDEQAVSPQLGLLYRLQPELALTASLASGFRAPPAVDVNLGLSNLPAGYTVIPNPELRAERSQGLEIGVRGRYPRLEYSATAFVSRYRDLIVSRAPLPCPADPRCVVGATGTFQSQNVARARIHGFEASARYRIDGPWSAQASVAYTFGADTGRDRPLNSIEPLRLVAAVAYDHAGLGARLHVTHARAKEHVDRSAGALFATPAFTVVDFTASWQLGPQIHLSAGVFNLFDRKYWLWSDLRDVLNPGPTIDRYTQQGRNFSVLLRATL